MSKYNFDEIVNRREQQSKKWTAYSQFGVEVCEEILPLWIADMDFKCEPRILDALKTVVDYGIVGYDAPPVGFYDSFIAWQKKRNQWEIKSEWLNGVPGVVPGICNAIRSLTQENDKILIQPPVYYPFFRSINLNHRELVENKLVREDDKYTIDFDDFEAKIKECKMFILCNPHNPVGRVWTQEELKRMGDLCVKHNVIIVSDEIHSDLLMKGYKHYPIANLSQEYAKITITLTAPSKSFNVAGLAQSVAIIPNEDLRTKYVDGLVSMGIMHMASFGVAGFNASYKYGEEWLGEALDYIEGNIDYVLHYIEENLPNVHAHRPEGTFLMWLDFREVADTPEELMNKLIHKGKLIIEDGSCFGENGRCFCRFNIASPRCIIEDAMERISVALSE